MTPDQARQRAVAVAVQAVWDGPGGVISDNDLMVAIAAYEAALWQPIETAPRDGTRVLFFAPHYKGASDAIEGSFHGSVQRIDQWKNGAWWQMRPGQPYTHWRPLPAGPGGAA